MEAMSKERLEDCEKAWNEGLERGHAIGQSKSSQLTIATVRNFNPFTLELKRLEGLAPAPEEVTGAKELEELAAKPVQAKHATELITEAVRGYSKKAGSNGA